LKRGAFMGNTIERDKVFITSINLANTIGLNKSIVLNQIYHCIEENGKLIDGNKWICSSFESWSKIFTFWSLNTIKRIFKSLEEDGIIVSGVYNDDIFDKTKWYAINYDKVLSVGINLTCDLF